MFCAIPRALLVGLAALAFQPDSAITMLFSAVHWAPVHPAAEAIRIPSALFCAADPETLPPVDDTRVDVDPPLDPVRLPRENKLDIGLNSPLADIGFVIGSTVGDFPAISARNVADTE